MRDIQNLFQLRLAYRQLMNGHHFELQLMKAYWGKEILF